MRQGIPHLRHLVLTMETSNSITLNTAPSQNFHTHLEEGGSATETATSSPLPSEQVSADCGDAAEQNLLRLEAYGSHKRSGSRSQTRRRLWFGRPGPGSAGRLAPGCRCRGLLAGASRGRRSSPRQRRPATGAHLTPLSSPVLTMLTKASRVAAPGVSGAEKPPRPGRTGGRAEGGNGRGRPRSGILARNMSTPNRRPFPVHVHARQPPRAASCVFCSASRAPACDCCVVGSHSLFSLPSFAVAKHTRRGVHRLGRARVRASVD
ncbi:uncharacterized protein LOC123379440 [Felis catus]|uniref:uncharacterized protein LOC123379440 n=1 Tax=Felis catus TaxID=9685 RepID=UPI001D19E128|nr:uncharacterized protein LOC123379440 [Felis catus]